MPGLRLRSFSLEKTGEGLCVREHDKCGAKRTVRNERLTATGARTDELFRACHSQSSAFCVDEVTHSAPSIVTSCYPAGASRERYRGAMLDILDRPEEHFYSECKLVR